MGRSPEPLAARDPHTYFRPLTGGRHGMVRFRYTIAGTPQRRPSSLENGNATEYFGQTEAPSPGAGGGGLRSAGRANQAQTYLPQVPALPRKYRIAQLHHRFERRERYSCPGLGDLRYLDRQPGDLYLALEVPRQGADGTVVELGGVAPRCLDLLCNANLRK